MLKYVINLAEASERLESIRRQLGDAFERIEAKRTGEVNRFRWWCAVLRPRVKGELGCAESHKEAWRRLVASGEKCAAIFEDDARVDERHEEALRKAEEFVRGRTRAVVLLADHRDGKKGLNAKDAGYEKELVEPEGFATIIPTEWDHCSEAYVIGREAASMLLKKQTPIRVPVDWWGYYRHKGWIELFRIDPPIATQQEERFATSLGEDRYDVTKEKSAAKRVWWKARRVVGAMIDAILDGKAGW